MKRIVSLVLFLLIMIFSLLATNAEEVSLSAQAYVLFCADSGQVMLSHNSDMRLPMASTTKIMTALIALEYAQKNDKVVEFTGDMAAEGSSMYLQIGDRVRLSDLAAGMMTVSGNDAANAAAISIAGSEEKFARIMNSRASEIGMKNTNFTNPSGLPDEGHYSTACDMALLMAEAMKNESFKALTNKKSVTVSFVSPKGKTVTYSNHNRLLSMYEYTTGGKTGYTKSAGRCLVTSACRNNLNLVAVTLNDKNDWQDHIALYEYGFEQYSAVMAGENDTVYDVKVIGSQTSVVTARVENVAKKVVDSQSLADVKTTVYIPPMVFAPVKKGDVVGKVVCVLNGEVVLQSDIIAQQDAEYMQISPLVRFLRRLL